MTIAQLERLMKDNPYVRKQEGDTPCVLCGNSQRIRIMNTLLTEISNPQCLDGTACLEERMNARE